MVRDPVSSRIQRAQVHEKSNEEIHQVDQQEPVKSLGDLNNPEKPSPTVNYYAAAPKKKPKLEISLEERPINDFEAEVEQIESDRDDNESNLEDEDGLHFTDKYYAIEEYEKPPDDIKRYDTEEARGLRYRLLGEAQTPPQD